ncbi:MAG TPA: FAD-binding oxidoreductase [Thermoleophilaceae bacterium]
MQRRQLNLSLDLELLNGELRGRCHDGNGGDHRFSGWLGLIGTIDSLVYDDGRNPMLISQSSRFAELQSRIDGQVLTAGDDAWDASRQTFNLTHDQQPAALVRVASAPDVAEAVRYAAKHGLRIAPQSTGHNAGPIQGLEDALLIRTDDLQEVKIDIGARRARVGSGVRWAAVADPASEAGLAPLSGSSRDVGVTGYSLGGGVGWLGRKYGLQSNALTAVEIVTADGELRRIDHDNETDLFWAVRGGGGNYGVVTALEFELFPVPELYAGALFFPYERASEVMHAWHDYVSAGLPDEITTVGRVVQVPPLEEIPEILRGKSFTVLQAAYLGSETDGAELIRPLVALGPEMNTFGMVEPGALGFLAMDPDAPLPYVGSSRLISDVGSAGIDAFIDAAGPGSGSQLANVELRQLGGALGRRTPGHGARATLDGDYLVFAVGGVFTPDAYGELHRQAEGVSQALSAWDSGERYLNFEEGEVDARVFFDADTWRLLRALRTEWDPKGLFLANHEIKES